MQMYKNRNGKQQTVVPPIRPDTQHPYEVIHTCIATHCTSSLIHTLIWLRRLKDEYKHRSTLEKTVHVKIIPAPWKKWRGVCVSVPQRRDGQTETDSEDTVSVRAAGPHSAVNRANTRWRQASQCTQESAVKYQGEAHTRTAVAEACYRSVEQRGHCWTKAAALSTTVHSNFDPTPGFVLEFTKCTLTSTHTQTSIVLTPMHFWSTVLSIIEATSPVALVWLLLQSLR